MTKIDECKQIFLNYKQDFATYINQERGLSESDTRSKILDKIFIDILGWEESDIKREGHVGHGYFDYKFTTPAFKFVVEAKKDLSEFILPDSGGSKFKISTLINKGNDKTIAQIREYLVGLSLSVGVISNGHQFIIARFVNNDGADWKDNECYIFRNLDEINNDFITFYNLLSKSSVINSRTIKFIEEKCNGRTVLEKLGILNYGGALVRNELSTKLIQIIADVFENIHDLENKEMLKACYVENQDAKKQNSELGILFPDDPPTFDDKIEKIRNTVNTREKIKNEISKKPNSAPNPIIIIGGKGAGKTTFIKYFLEVTLKEDRGTKDIPVIYKNFENFTFQQIQDTKNIYASIVDSVERKYQKYKLANIEVLREIYDEEICTNLLGIWNYIKLAYLVG